LAGLAELQSLNISGTPVADLTPLAGLANLQILDITGTPVADLTPLAGLGNLEKGAQENGGLKFRRCTNITDPVLIELSKKDNPERTIETLRYLREQAQKRELEAAENPPPVPAQLKAPLQVEFDGAVLKALQPYPPELANPKAAKRALQAWEALKESLDDLTGAFEGCNNPAVPKALAAYGKALGASFESLNQIALGVHGQRIQGLAAVAENFLSDDLAAELKTLAANNALYAPRFPEWEDYKNDIASETLPKETLESAFPKTDAITDQLRAQPEHADASISGILDDLKQSLIDGGLTEPLQVQGFLRSHANVQFVICEKAIQEAQSKKEEVKKTFTEKVIAELEKRAVKRVATAVEIAAVGSGLYWIQFLFSHSADLMALAAKFPEHFRTAKLVLDWLKLFLKT
ncbi:MAG: hypothetical protein HQL43_14135, partial [Alphaproteobacteria bacterium]|nr:hypothetical protein [Alphaproteobacteria bacterium]